MFPHNLLSFSLFALGVVHASPMSRDTGKAALKFSRNLNTGGFGSLAKKDRARAQALKQRLRLSGRGVGGGSVSVTNAGVTYTAEVGIGDPPTEYTLLIDTGSSNTWIGADSGNPYHLTSSSEATMSPVSVVYGSGWFAGMVYNDRVTLASELVIDKQSIGVANITAGFDGNPTVDGILGLGPVDLTENTDLLVPQIPTVMDNLYAQGRISQEAVGIYFAPYSEPDSDGELTFGGVDTSKTTGPVSYFQLTTVKPASDYWGINQSIFYGDTVILPQTAGIVDTGTTLVLLPTDAFRMYQSATGGTMDDQTELLKITSDQYAKLQPLSFVIGGTSFSLSPNAQIWPRALNSYVGGSAGSIYLVVSDTGSPSGRGLDFINGYSFLERYYSVYDTTNRRIGFASTAYTNATTN